MESIAKAWERLQEYILAYPHHGMDEWLILQSFYNMLTPTSRTHINAAAKGAFFDLTIAKATTLVEKMISNQGWSEERHQPRIKGMHTIKGTDMLAAKMDLLLKRLDERAKFKEHMNNYALVQAIDSHSASEVCGNGGHLGNDCPKTREDAAFINNNNGYRPQGGQGWNQSHPPYQGGNNYNSNFNLNFNSNQPYLKDLVLGQAKINKSLNKKLAANDKTLESISIKIETLSSALKNQLSFNKMIETQLA
jgi:hypothetical protein